MESDEVGSADAGRLEASRADATRLRLGLEGSRRFELGARAALHLRLELGFRRDGGDAETGTGLEAGAGVRYTAGALTIEGAVRTLVAHEESGYREWGASGAVRVAPGAFGRGLSLILAPAWGNAASAAERLWSMDDAAGLASGRDFEAKGRLEAELHSPQLLGQPSPRLPRRGDVAVRRHGGRTRSFRPQIPGSRAEATLQYAPAARSPRRRPGDNPDFRTEATLQGPRPTSWCAGHRDTSPASGPKRRRKPPGMEGGESPDPTPPRRTRQGVIKTAAGE